MNEMTQPYPQAQAVPASWFQFATRHRASIASLVVLAFPLVMPFTALAANILGYANIRDWDARNWKFHIARNRVPREKLSPIRTWRLEHRRPSQCAC